MWKLSPFFAESSVLFPLSSFFKGKVGEAGQNSEHLTRVCCCAQGLWFNFKESQSHLLKNWFP